MPMRDIRRRFSWTPPAMRRVWAPRASPSASSPKPSSPLDSFLVSDKRLKLINPVDTFPSSLIIVYPTENRNRRELPALIEAAICDLPLMAVEAKSLAIHFKFKMDWLLSSLQLNKKVWKSLSDTNNPIDTQSFIRSNNNRQDLLFATGRPPKQRVAGSPPRRTAGRAITLAEGGPVRREDAAPRLGAYRESAAARRRRESRKSKRSFSSSGVRILA